ncbi:MAG: glycosyltransferase family 2 protein [Treponema sp.]
MQVSIIIVNYNTKELIKNCINSIYKYTQDIQYEIIVSDNGSTDGSIEMLKSEFPNVILIENNANLGFGTANNRGLKIAKGKYIFYLNSDTVLLNNAVKIFYDYWENSSDKESIGALGCNLLDKNKNINSSYADFPNINKSIYDGIKLNYGLWKLFFLKILGHQINQEKKVSIYQKKIGEVDFIVGADLFLKNDKNAYFDENIFLYCEEVDLEFQLMKLGKKRLLIAGPEIIHYEGLSAKKSVYMKEICSFSAIYNNISRIYYYKKNISKLKARLIKLLTFFIWTNPLIVKYNYKYIKKLLTV